VSPRDVVINAVLEAGDGIHRDRVVNLCEGSGAALRELLREGLLVEERDLIRIPDVPVGVEPEKEKERVIVAARENALAFLEQPGSRPVEGLLAALTFAVLDVGDAIREGRAS
jgi:hypothetical protein